MFVSKKNTNIFIVGKYVPFDFRFYVFNNKTNKDEEVTALEILNFPDNYEFYME